MLNINYLAEPGCEKRSLLFASLIKLLAMVFIILNKRSGRSCWMYIYCWIQYTNIFYRCLSLPPVSRERSHPLTRKIMRDVQNSFMYKFNIVNCNAFSSGSWKKYSTYSLPSWYGENSWTNFHRRIPLSK